jgi:hypothetical protein
MGRVAHKKDVGLNEAVSWTGSQKSDEIGITMTLEGNGPWKSSVLKPGRKQSN